MGYIFCAGLWGVKRFRWRGSFEAGLMGFVLREVWCRKRGLRERRSVAWLWRIDLGGGVGSREGVKLPSIPIFTLAREVSVLLTESRRWEHIEDPQPRRLNVFLCLWYLTNKREEHGLGRAFFLLNVARFCDIRS